MLLANGRLGRASVEVSEFSANIIGIRMTKFLEDRQSLLPSITGGGIASSMVSIAKVIQDDGFAIVIAEFAVQAKRLLVASESVFMLAKVMVSVAKTIQGFGYAHLVVEVLE